MSYRQNTELFVQAWHWNPKGTWSDPSGKGYFTGDSTPAEMIRHSYGYSLPHRGVTRNDGTKDGFSRLDDGDPTTYWKSNPFLTQPFTGENDALHLAKVRGEIQSGPQFRTTVAVAIQTNTPVNNLADPDLDLQIALQVREATANFDQSEIAKLKMLAENAALA